jgi:hypothetical protein
MHGSTILTAIDTGNSQKSLTIIRTCADLLLAACLLIYGDLPLDASTPPAVAGSLPPDVDLLVDAVASSRPRPFPARILLATEIRDIPTRAGNRALCGILLGLPEPTEPARPTFVSFTVRQRLVKLSVCVHELKAMDRLPAH